MFVVAHPARRICGTNPKQRMMISLPKMNNRISHNISGRTSGERHKNTEKTSPSHPKKSSKLAANSDYHDPISSIQSAPAIYPDMANDCVGIRGLIVVHNGCGRTPHFSVIERFTGKTVHGCKTSEEAYDFIERRSRKRSKKPKVVILINQRTSEREQFEEFA